jgi:hypothetical protein
VLFSYRIAYKVARRYTPYELMYGLHPLRAKQTLAKMTLEIEWETYFEPNSYGFRLGWSCKDAAIKAIFLAI